MKNTILTNKWTAVTTFISLYLSDIFGIKCIDQSANGQLESKIKKGCGLNPMGWRQTTLCYLIGGAVIILKVAANNNSVRFFEY